MAMAEMEQRPAWKIVEAAVNLYFDQKSIRDRHEITARVKRGAGK